MEHLREPTIMALQWVAAYCEHSSAGDHLEALAMIRSLTPKRTPEDLALVDAFESRARAKFLQRRSSEVDRDARTRAADAVRAARAVVAALCPPEEVEL